jgi:alkylation response protein AidB-like acyl-CoA dehydrogenase
MEFAFTEDQRALQAQARDFLDARLPPARVAEIAASEHGWDPALWREVAALEWSGVSVAEAHGGVGLGIVEEAILFEELGRVCFPGPFLSTVALARDAVACDPALLRDLAAGRTTWTLAEDPSTVPDLAIVDRVVVWHEGALWVADRAQRRSRPTVDATRRLGRVRFAPADLELLASGETAAAAVARGRARARVALACEAVGVAQRALDLAVEHARTRVQYGRPIASFQAVSHQLATTYAELELSRSLAYWAAWCLEVGSDRVEVATAAAKAHSSQTAVRACERSIQVHGGTGFSWDFPLHLFYKRALWISAFGGSAREHRTTIAAALLDGDLRGD